MTVVVDNSFTPIPGLRNAHLQTFLASTGMRRWWVKHRDTAMLDVSERLIVECSDGAKLEGHWSKNPQAKAVVVLIPGWEGSHESSYLLSLSTQLYADGYSIFRLNTRDHGGTHALNEGAFHTWRLQEIIDGVRHGSCVLADGLPTYLCAFSMGGNLSIRSLAQDGMNLRHTFTFNAPVRPHNVLDELDGSPYRTVFVKHWQESLAKKQAAFPHIYNFSSAAQLATVRDICDFVLKAGYGPCDTLEDYLDGYTITAEHIQNLQGRATIVTAKDDPIIPVSDYQALPDSNQMEMIITEYGGHCGFIAAPGQPNYVYRVVSERIDADLANLSIVAA